MAGQSDSNDVIAMLTQVLEARRQAAPESSYVATLYHDGLDRILQKIGEEATETVLAAKNAGHGAGAGPRPPVAGADRAPASGAANALIAEVADLWFHSMVMLVFLGHRPASVLTELERRFGTSGLAEKAARQQGPAANTASRGESEPT